MVFRVPGAGTCLWAWIGGCLWLLGPWECVFGRLARIACRILTSISCIFFSLLSSSTAMKLIRSFFEVIPLSSLSDKPVFSGVAPTFSMSSARLREGSRVCSLRWSSFGRCSLKGCPVSSLGFFPRYRPGVTRSGPFSVGLSVCD